MIVATERAVAEIKAQSERRGKPPNLRIGIRGGGCTGFAYSIDWSDEPPKGKDYVFSQDGVNIYIDPKSFVFLNGSELDFEVSLMGMGFKIKNPQQKGECSCGKSVQF